MSKEKENEIAKVLREAFISPNVEDSNGEVANIVDAIDRLASSIFCAARAIRGERPSE